MKHYYKYPIFYIICFWTSTVFGQEIVPKQEVNIDDLGIVSDDFQEHFFEALKQKAITNHEKAIDALEACIAIDPKPAYLYFELGKNHLKLKEYKDAVLNFNKVLEIEPNRRYVLELLFESHFAQRNYAACIEVMEKLVPFNAIFKEQLANLYFLEKRYEEALVVVDALDDEFGKDIYRQNLREKIIQRIKNPNSQITRLEKKILKYPKEEQHYLNLIYLYSQDDQEKKAFEVAQRLLQVKSDSELVHLALYKFYLNSGKTEEAIASMKIVLGSNQLEQDAKHKVITDFLGFVNNSPTYESVVLEVAKTMTDAQKDSAIFNDIGHYFYTINKKELALNFYERGFDNAIHDLEVIRRVLALQMDLQRYEKAKDGSEIAMEIYPSQSMLYLINAKALLKLSDYENAIEVLSIGMDYIIDDPKMESDFYTVMSKAYEGLGDANKAAEYQKKAIQIHKKS